MQVKRSVGILPVLALAAVLAGCITPGPSARVQSTGATDMGSARSAAYHGPKAAIAVADFEDKTVSSGRYRAAYGRGMQEMLTTALFNSNRFIVLEREKLDAVMAEQDLGATGRFRKSTAAPIGELEGAQLLVAAAVTGFDPGTGGAGGTLSKVGGLLGDKRIGSVFGGYKRAHLAIDLRIIDTATGRILAATSVEGKAHAYDLGGSILGNTSDGSLNTFARTPMEKAIRSCINEAVNFVASRTPENFYRF